MKRKNMNWKRRLAGPLAAALILGELSAASAGAMEARASGNEEAGMEIAAEAETGTGTYSTPAPIASALLKLQTTLEGMDKYEETDYTWESWQRLATARSRAGAILARKEDPSLTLTEVTRAQTTLETADKTLVANMSAVLENLQEVLLNLDQFKQEDYTEASWSRLTAARRRAGDILAMGSPDLAKVQQARSELKAAINGLITKLQDARQRLDKKLQAAKTLDSKKYTADTWKKFQTAVTNASNVYNNKDAVLPMVNSAAAALDMAKAALKLQSAADSEAAAEAAAKAAAQAAAKELKTTRAAAQKRLKAETPIYKKGQRLYTDASWRVYASAYSRLSKSKSSSAKTIRDLTNAVPAARKKLKQANIAAASIRYVKRIGCRKTAITIKKVSRAKCYLVYRSTKKSSGYKLRGIVSKTLYIDSKADPGRTYYYKAIPVKSENRRRYQPFASGYTKYIPASYLNGIVAKKRSVKRITLQKLHTVQIKPGPEKLRLTWDVPSGVKYSLIQFRLDGSGIWQTAGKLKWTFRSANVQYPEKKYWFRIVYVWSDGSQTAGGEKSFG